MKSTEITKSYVRVTSLGCIVWRNEKGQVHRDGNKPAMIYKCGNCSVIHDGWLISTKRWHESR